jgi:hypothetical protein
MGTQKGIANLVRLKGADYVLAVKGNQGKLHKKICNSPGGLEVVAEHCHSREGGNPSQCGNDAKEIFKK